MAAIEPEYSSPSSTACRFLRGAVVSRFTVDYSGESIYRTNLDYIPVQLQTCTTEVSYALTWDDTIKIEPEYSSPCNFESTIFRLTQDGLVVHSDCEKLCFSCSLQEQLYSSSISEIYRTIACVLTWWSKLSQNIAVLAKLPTDSYAARHTADLLSMTTTKAPVSPSLNELLYLGSITDLNRATTCVPCGLSWDETVTI